MIETPRPERDVGYAGFVFQRIKIAVTDESGVDSIPLFLARRATKPLIAGRAVPMRY
jgi:hypothetical protein